VDFQSERTEEQLATLSIIERICDVIRYLETFCCKGRPAQWSLPIRDIQGDPQAQEPAAAQKPDQAKLSKHLQKAFGYFVQLKSKATKLLDDDDDGMAELVRQQRELLMTQLIPNFVSENMMSYKLIRKRQTQFKMDKYQSGWRAHVSPFAGIVQSGQPLDLDMCQDSVFDGLKLLIWCNLPCNSFRIEHIQRITLHKIFNVENEMEAGLLDVALAASHDVQSFKIKIQDVYNNIGNLIERFKRYKSYVDCMIILALRVFVRHNQQRNASVAGMTANPYQQNGNFFDCIGS